jgi:parvulin-like peptidyl-prolyl isomerase
LPASGRAAALARVACIAVAALALGCGARDAVPYAARVDGHEISLDAMRRAVEARLASEPGAALDDVAAEELERLIDEQVGLNRAEQLALTVTPAEVEGRILLVHGENFELRDAAYDEQVRRQMLGERAALRDLADQLAVSEEEALRQFESNQAAYNRPERVQIRQIVVADAEKARELHGQLSAGADFATLARDHSQAPEAHEGGLLPAFAAGELPEVFDRAFHMKPGQTSEVLESPHGYHIFRLVERLPARAAEFETVREDIVGQLQRQRLVELKRTWLRDLRRLAKIEVNDRLLEDLK